MVINSSATSSTESIDGRPSLDIDALHLFHCFEFLTIDRKRMPTDMSGIHFDFIVIPYL